MILSFSKNFPWGDPTNFEQKIIEGTKIHTIREDPHNRWKPGMKIHAATGVRTKNYNCFYEDECTGVQDIFMTYFFGGLEVTIGDKYLYWEDKLKLAKNDGFDSIDQMVDWFFHKKKDAVFSGKLIHWTDLRY